jgi:hypothetical protein
MRSSNSVIVLSAVVTIFAPVAASIGLFWKRRGISYIFSTLRDQEVQIFGKGIYKYDTLFFGAGYKGQDLVVLCLGVPLIIIALVLYKRELVSGYLFLLGMLGYFAYVYASMALGAAYNNLFLVYIIIFSTSLFGFILVFSSCNQVYMVSEETANMPRIGLAIFMIVSGLITLVVWGAPLIDALHSGNVPDRMGSYTTMVTYALDLAIITPSTFLCGILFLRFDPLGYVIAVPLLSIIMLLAPQIILSTIFQKLSGVPLTTAEMIGPVAGFVVLGVIAVWLLILILRSFPKIA